MRYKILSLLVLVLVFTAAGCQQQAKKPDMQVNPAVNEGKYPSEVRSWLRNMRSYQIAGVVEKGGKTYLLVSGGEKRTGGYQVNIQRVQEADDKLTVTVEMNEPDGPTAQVISYPNAVYTMNRRLAGKTVEFVNSSGNEPIPQIIGIQPTIPFEAASANIKIMNMNMNNQKISARGIARVFEGTIDYRFVNSAGKTVKSGVVQTQAGAPDWGSFVLDKIRRPSGATQIQIFWTSPKDGSPQDMISIPL